MGSPFRSKQPQNLFYHFLGWHSSTTTVSTIPIVIISDGYEVEVEVGERNKEQGQSKIGHSSMVTPLNYTRLMGGWSPPT